MGARRIGTEIDLRVRTATGRVIRWTGHTLALLIAAGGIASFFVGPESPAVRVVAGVAGVLIVLVYAVAGWWHRGRPRSLVIDHEGILIRNARGARIARLAWTELSGVGLMTNQVALERERRAPLERVWAAVPVWLELYPADAAAVARHPGLSGAWGLGAGTAPGEQQRWLLHLGDTLGQRLPIEEAVQRWRPELWRGHRSGTVAFGGHERR
ncbi:MAG TPA: hypothetical protein VKZ81_17905 [Pseudonocardia sp.]|uniref:hypothetical protein n=1 Tax=Pseudonocardia sp. TaxID=60912 RepID=UPI002B4AD666|nr:hypothetical protein [Pseudonocardia sp.]HLU57333.1 hypothetical protein [Pseudonocardia sp.]